jgi:TetR/AcrR family transcriptional regulator
VGKLRDRERTRERILQAAKGVFTEKGYDAATVSEIARRVGASKQLVHHHFGNKEALFREVHLAKFRPQVEWSEALSDDPGELLAERFAQRADDPDYTRFLTWEAASGRGNVPGREARKRRQMETAAVLEKMQTVGKLPGHLDPALMQLAIVALTTYPLAFGQNTRLITGRSPTDPSFQRAWSEFLRSVGPGLFGAAAPPRKAARKRR